MLTQPFPPILFAQIITGVFLSILFLQSGLDKVFDFSGNLRWLKEHFSKTPLRNQVAMMLITITIAEVATGALSLVGVYQLAMHGEKTIAMYGAQLGAVDIVLLFFGQRIAKDYVGAATLVPYFLLTVAHIVILTH